MNVDVAVLCVRVEVAKAMTSLTTSCVFAKLGDSLPREELDVGYKNSQGPATEGERSSDAAKDGRAVSGSNCAKLVPDRVLIGMLPDLGW